MEIENVELQEVLEDGYNYMRQVSNNINIFTDAVQQNDVEKISQNYEDLKEGVSYINDIIENCKYFLELDYSEILINEQSAQEIIDQYNQLVNEIDNKFNAEEYYQMSNLIENNLLGHFKKMMLLFEEINEKVNEKQH